MAVSARYFAGKLPMYVRRVLVFDSRHLAEDPYSDVYLSVCHECCHIGAPPDDEHGPFWSARFWRFAVDYPWALVHLRQMLDYETADVARLSICAH
jgi:hypothetical protein